MAANFIPQVALRCCARMRALVNASTIASEHCSLPLRVDDIDEYPSRFFASSLPRSPMNTLTWVHHLHYLDGLAYWSWRALAVDSLTFTPGFL